MNPREKKEYPHIGRKEKAVDEQVPRSYASREGKELLMLWARMEG